MIAKGWRTLRSSGQAWVRKSEKKRKEKAGPSELGMTASIKGKFKSKFKGKFKSRSFMTTNVVKAPQGCSGTSSVAGPQQIAPRRQRRNHPVGRALYVRESSHRLEDDGERRWAKGAQTRMSSRQRASGRVKRDATEGEDATLKGWRYMRQTDGDYGAVWWREFGAGSFGV
jgi:hypothetical protein